MTYPELRKRLRAEGFINHEIFHAHIMYLCLRAMGIEDDEMVFDKDNGVLVHNSARHKYKEIHVAPDPEFHCAYIIEGEKKTKVGPFT